MQQRILIVLNEGAFQGASITNDVGDPQPLDLAALAALVPTINSAAIAQTDLLAADHAAAIAAKDAELTASQAALAELTAYKEEMIERVSSVLQSGDPAQYEALATEFLTPAQELERQAILAQIAELQAKLEP
jgi:hypothetical protein